MHPLAGVYAAAVTPLRQDFSPDLEAIPSLLKFLSGRGNHGILLLGTTGEGPSFSQGERTAILREAMRARETLLPPTGGTLKLLAGTGTPSLTETISLTQSAFDLGCDCVVVLPPYYYRKATEEGLFNYFQDLIRQAVPSNGFLIGYHIPGTAGIGFTTNLITRLKEAFPHQFAGIKDSSHDAEFAHELGERFGKDILVLTGTDTYLELALENHAQGCITAPANLISPLLRQEWEAFQRGEDTSVFQKRISEIRNIMEKYLPFPPILKALLSKQHGFPRWPVRPPLVDVPTEIVEKLNAEINPAGG